MATPLMSRTVVAQGAADRIGLDVAASFADDVDRQARFPIEALDALRSEGMLGMLVPVELGGGGCSIVDVAEACTALGQHCSATAMIFAMHQIQIACMVRHALPSPFFTEYLARVAADQLLVASATSEIGVSGDLRSSVCAIERSGDSFSIRKQAPVISYAEYADSILVTARGSAESPANDQIVALLDAGEFQLERTTTWDTLGFRGTCSPGFVLTGNAAEDHVLGVPFATVACETMLPVSHIFWSSLWLGIASAAVGRAREYIRTEARRSPGKTPAASVRLAAVVSQLQTMRAVVADAIRDYERASASSDELSSMSFALRMNNLKIVCSTSLVEIVSQAMLVCGIAGYGNSSKFSLGRMLRDAFGAALMINNDRIYGTNAAILLVTKDD